MGGVRYLVLVMVSVCVGMLCGGGGGGVRAELELKKVVYLDKADFYSQDGSYQYSNYLFRGNQPKTTVDGKVVFAYDLLVSYLQNVSIQNGFKLPPNFYLIDIKYIYDPTDPVEHADVVLDQSFFEKNSKLGETRIQSIWGDLTDPNNEVVSERNVQAANLSSWQRDDLPTLIPQLKHLLTSQVLSRPVVIYFHCECGCDRTGEVGAAYAMKYLHMTYKAAVAWDNAIAGRPIMTNHKWAAAWYCYYLALKEDIDAQCSSF